jgi:DNA-binding transcriptional LysR family regulator
MQLRGVDTNLIIALRALLVHQNVTKAAKDVGLSQSSMSHALSRLRAHFDDPLLVPAGRELVLTDRAKDLIEPVAEAVARLERVFARAEPFNPRTSRRTFRIAATDNVELYVLPYLAGVLQKSAPGVELRVCALPENWVMALQRGDIDLKLGRKYPVPAALETQDLSQEHFACVVRRGHPVGPKPSIREYAGLDHLLVTPTAPPTAEPSGYVDTVLAKQGLRRRIVLTVPHFLVAPFIVATSDLALTGPARLLDPFAKLLKLRRLEIPLKLTGYKLSQVWAARSRDDEAHAWLRSTIASALASPA